MELKNGAYLNQTTFIIFYHMFGVHPSALPWMFMNATHEEVLKTFDPAHNVGSEELPAE